MKNWNPIRDKSFDFAVRIVKFHKWLKESGADYDLAKQVLRSGTSIGANVAEAQSGQSKKDFIHKNHIAFKEVNETIYWLNLLNKSEIISDDTANSLLKDAEELRRILASIIKTSKESIRDNIKESVQH